MIFVLPDLSEIGAQRVAIDIGKRLADFGCSVSWATGGSGGLISETPSDSLLTFSPKALSKIPVLRVFESTIRLAVLLRKLPVDSFVIGISPFLNRVLCALKALRVIRGQLIIEDHAYPPESYPDEFTPLQRKIYRWSEFLYTFAHHLRVLTPEAEEYYAKRLGDTIRVSIVPNPIDTARVQQLAGRHRVANGSKPRLVYLGRQVSQKNIQFLIHAFAKLRQQLDAEFIVIGYGPLRKELVELANKLSLGDSIQFLESSTANFAWLQSADVFPIASKWEGMVLTVGEAMALGVPVVSTDFLAGQTFYLGKDQERGWMVGQGDLNSFVLALREAIIDKELAARKAAAAQHFVLNDMNPGQCAETYFRTFLVSQRGESETRTGR